MTKQKKITSLAILIVIVIVYFLYQNQKKSSTGLYQCPRNGYVNCMPILTEEAAKECTDNAIEWFETNCPNFQGIVY